MGKKWFNEHKYCQNALLPGHSQDEIFLVQCPTQNVALRCQITVPQMLSV
jgi:hypothetical protein